MKNFFGNDFSDFSFSDSSSLREHFQHLKEEYNDIKSFLESPSQSSTGFFPIPIGTLSGILKRAYNLAENIIGFRFGHRKLLMEYEFQYIEPLRSFLPPWPDNPLKNLDDATLHVLYHLTVGHISLCLNEICLNYFLYEESKKWFQLAMNAFWEAKLLNYKLIDLDPKHDNEEIQLYKYLIMLNIGKCHFNYAMQHRRSDYKAAAERFEQIIIDYPKRVSPPGEKSIEDYINSSQEHSRQWKLIMMDACAGMLRIYRQKREYEEDPNNAKLIKLIARMETFNQIFFVKKSEDSEDYRAQILIEKAITYRKMRLFDSCLLELSRANDSNNDTNRSTSAKYNNVDSLNNFSSVLRARIFIDKNYDFSKIKDKGDIKFPQDLINNLKSHAKEDNLYSLREYVQWYGEYLAAPNPYASCILTDNNPFEISDSNKNEMISPATAINRLGEGLDEILASIRLTSIVTQIEELVQTIQSLSAESAAIKETLKSVSQTVTELRNHLSTDCREVKKTLGNILQILEPLKDQGKLPRSIFENVYILEHTYTPNSDVNTTAAADNNAQTNNVSSPAKSYSLNDIDHLLDELILYYPFDLSEGNRTLTDSNVSPIRPDQNLVLQYLKCVFFTRIGSYSRVLGMLESLCSRPELSYIRKGTLGLKARYMLAKSYLASNRFKDALRILEEVRAELQKQSSPSDPHEKIDIRIELLYGKCLCCLGRYKRAQEEVYGYFSLPNNFNKHPNSVNNNDISLHVRLHLAPPNPRLPSSEESLQKERFYMDAMFCALRMNDKREFEYLYSIYFKTYMEAPSAVSTIASENSNPDTPQYRASNKRDEIDRLMLQGYVLAFCNSPVFPFELSDVSNAKPEVIRASLQYFEQAHTLLLSCSSSEDSIYEIDRESILNISDREKELKDSECRSAYVLTLIRLWRIEHNTTNPSITDDDSTQDKLLRFIIDLPVSCPISLEAAFDIADWIAEYAQQEIYGFEKRNRHGELVRRLYESFAKCTLYPEQGTTAFETLLHSAEFRYYKAQKQGELFAALLQLYRPIQKFRESCRLTLEKLGDDRIGQYTRLSTLKALLRNTADGEPAPHLRSNNGSVMNDLFEGKVFPKLLNFNNDPIPVSPLNGFLNANLGRAIYITSFTSDSPSTSGVFNMWDTYGDKENGCIIQYDNSFFDICNSPSESPNDNISRYFISAHTDEDYPLYEIQYVQSNGTLTDANQNRLLQQTISSIISSWETFYKLLEPELNLPKDLVNIEFSYLICLKALEAQDTDATKVYINLLNTQRAQQWQTFFENVSAAPYTAKDESTRSREATQYLLSFAADRLNEIRYLFKTDNYQYEKEYRVFIASSEHYVDTQRTIPCTYVEINRPLENLSVILGSKIPALDVVHLTAWMKQTQRVVHVHQSSINRP